MPGCRLQIDCKTLRNDSASSVSSSLGRASGLPAGPDLTRFVCRWAGSERVGGFGEFDGEKDIRSSAEGSSSSAFRFRLLLVKDTAMAMLAGVDMVGLQKSGLEWDGERCELCSWCGGGGVARTLFIAAKAFQGHFVLYVLQMFKDVRK